MLNKKEYNKGVLFTEGIESNTIDGLSIIINNLCIKYSNYTLDNVQMTSVGTNNIYTPVKHFALLTFKLK